MTAVVHRIEVQKHALMVGSILLLYVQENRRFGALAGGARTVQICSSFWLLIASLPPRLPLVLMLVLFTVPRITS